MCRRCFRRPSLETATRTTLMEKTRLKLAAIEKTVAGGRLKNRDKIIAAAARATSSFRMAKFYDWEAGEASFRCWVKTDKLQREQQLDGCYVIASDVSRSRLDKDKLVENYKRLQ